MPTKKQLQEQNRDLQVDLTKVASIMAEFDRFIHKEAEKNDELKEQFNGLIDLIEEADTEEKINPLKEFDHLE